MSSTSVNLPERQRAGPAQEYGLLVTGLVDGSPADAAGLLVGDVIVGFEGEAGAGARQLVMRLRGDRVGKAADADDAARQRGRRTSRSPSASGRAMTSRG